MAASVAASNSFEAVADEWLNKMEREGRSAVTMKKLRWLLAFINASLGGTSDRVDLGARAPRDASQDGDKGPLRDGQTAAQHLQPDIPIRHRDGAGERDVAADLRGALIAPKPTHRAAITNGS